MMNGDGAYRATPELLALAEQWQIHPELNHVGLLVRDIHRAAGSFAWIPGLAPWNFLHFRAEEFEMLVSEPFHIHVAKSSVNGVGLELIQPYDSPDSYMERWLAQHGEGLHHFAFDFKDNEEHIRLVEAMKDSGYSVVYSALFRGSLIHYVAAPDGGVVSELKSKRNRSEET